MSFIFGGVSTVILLFFMFVDEDIAHIEHILQLVSILTLLAIVARYVLSSCFDYLACFFVIVILILTFKFLFFFIHARAQSIDSR